MSDAEGGRSSKATQEEDDESDLEEEGVLFEAEGKEKVVYVVDARLEATHFEKAVEYAVRHLKRLIRAKSSDLVGVTLYGDSGSRRGAPIVALAKASGARIRLLRRAVERKKEGDLEALVASEVEPDKVVESRESCVRNGLWCAQAQLENARDPSRGTKSSKSIVAFASGERATEEGWWAPCFRLAADCKDQNVEIRVALFLDGGGSSSPTFWRRLLEANRADDDTSGELPLFKAEDAVTQEVLDRHVRKRLQNKGSYALTFLDTEEVCRVKKHAYLKPSQPSKPQTKLIHKSSGQDVTKVTRKEDVKLGSFLSAAEMRKFAKIGPDGRAYVSEASLKRSGDLELSRDSSEIRVLGFVDDAEPTLEEVCRVPATVLVPDEDKGPASTEIFAALVGAMARHHRCALALEATKFFSGSESQRRNPQLVLLEPVISDGPPLPTGLRVHVLPFADEKIPSAGRRKRPRDEEEKDDDDEEKDDSALAEAVSRVVAELPRHENGLTLPSSRILWAAVESVALGEDDAAITAAKNDARTLRSPDLPSLADAAAALDALCGTQEALDRLSTNKTPVDKSVVPDDLLSPAAAARHGGRAAWLAKLRVYTNDALKQAANYLELALKPTVKKKDDILAALADHILQPPDDHPRAMDDHE